MQTKQKRKKQLINGLFFIVCAFACNNVENKLIDKRIETAFFSIELPNENFSVIYDKDSLQGKLISNSDTLFFDIGFYVNSLTEKEPKVLYVPFDGRSNKRLMVDTRVVDTSGLIYADREDYDIDIYRKQNVFFTKSNGLYIKNTFPRIANNGGIVGIYCDSLKSCFGGKLKFSLYKRASGNLLKDSLYLKSFLTMRFRNKPMCY